MPVSGDDGLTFVICTGDEVVEAVLRPDGTYDFDPENLDHEKRGCPWAVAQAAVALPLLADIPTLSGTLRERLQPQIAPLILAGAPRARPYARGPPSRT